MLLCKGCDVLLFEPVCSPPCQAAELRNEVGVYKSNCADLISWTC